MSYIFFLPWFMIKGFSSSKDCNVNNTVVISIMLVHFGPLHVPNIERRYFTISTECRPTYKLGVF